MGSPGNGRGTVGAYCNSGRPPEPIRDAQPAALAATGPLSGKPLASVLFLHPRFGDIVFIIAAPGKKSRGGFAVSIAYNRNRMQAIGFRKRTVGASCARPWENSPIPVVGNDLRSFRGRAKHAPYRVRSNSEECRGGLRPPAGVRSTPLQGAVQFGGL